MGTSTPTVITIQSAAYGYGPLNHALSICTTPGSGYGYWSGAALNSALVGGYGPTIPKGSIVGSPSAYTCLTPYALAAEADTSNDTSSIVVVFAGQLPQNFFDSISFIDNKSESDPTQVPWSFSTNDPLVNYQQTTVAGQIYTIWQWKTKAGTQSLFASGQKYAVTLNGGAYNFNCCDCGTETNYRTLLQLRTSMMYRLGYAAMAATPPAGMVGLLNEFLIDAQKLLYRSYKQLETERFFYWPMTVGGRYYGLLNQYGCVQALDPYKVTWVGFEDLNQAWYELVKGIEPAMYTRAQVSTGWPVRYDIRSCIEIFPAPMAAYTLWIKGHFGLSPFAADSDQTTIDDEAVFLLALANAKMHYKQPDGKDIGAQAQSYVRNLVAGSHLTARYVPGVRKYIGATPPAWPLRGPPG